MSRPPSSAATNRRGPLDAALVQKLRYELKAHARACENEGTELEALEQAFTPLADELRELILHA